MPYIEPTIPFGNLKDVFFMRKVTYQVYDEIYRELKDNKVGGIFQMHLPTVVLKDPDTIKQVMVKEFNSFHDRGVYYDGKNDLLMKNLFFLGGRDWREVRAKLTPTFTSGKMKMMLNTLLECGVELQRYMEPIAARGDTIEINEVLARFTTDVIASCSFGIQCNCLKDPDAEFRAKGRQFFQRSALGKLGLKMNFFAPGLAAITKLGITPKPLADFFINIVKETVDYREKNNVKRDDFMHLLIQLKNKGFVEGDADDGLAKNTSSEDHVTSPEGAHSASPNHNNKHSKSSKKLSAEDLTAQAFVFFLAGFETSSTTMTFCMYEMAVNPDIQARVREEMDTVVASHGGKITYEGLQQMEYLDMVVAETLRKYPALTVLNRQCNKDYTLDSGHVIEAGVKVIVPVYALHHDPVHYPEPQRFDPERFTKEEKANRNQYTYLPFGEGPRYCIGMRFGLMQVKIGLISLLKNYEFRVSAKTVVPIIFDPKMLFLASLNGVHLQVVELKDKT